MIIAIADLAAAAGGEIIRPRSDAGGERRDGRWPDVVRGASIDSRSLTHGELFVAVPAERDGHDFVAAAARLGAAAALVSRPVDADIVQIVVDDTVAALGAMGGLARERLDGPVVGITGSVGKTSTKDLLASICALAGVTTASEKSLNNEMGVPLTLLNADELTRRTVLEMGARGVGHIAQLCTIGRPDVGIVTAVAAAHTEMFGSIDAVAAAKGELVEALPTDGTAVLNADDPRVLAMASRTSARVLTYGTSGTSADVGASDVVLDDELRAAFLLTTPWGSAPVRLGVRGRHNVGNALAAAAAALVTGVGIDDVVAGLGTAQLSPSRMDLIVLPDGGIVLDDAYNANPASMRAALAALGSVDAGRRVAVVGLMAELGDDAPRLHAEIAAEARVAGIEVVAVGTDLYGGDADGVTTVADLDELGERLDPPGPGEAVLLKASRVVGLDQVARRWRHGDRPAR
jgi:UDP-N-acetylmuramoyl-tripeptide--D-alanyl-D-alanine ligase